MIVCVNFTQNGLIKHLLRSYYRSEDMTVTCYVTSLGDLSISLKYQQVAEDRRNILHNADLTRGIWNAWLPGQGPEWVTATIV